MKNENLTFQERANRLGDMLEIFGLGPWEFPLSWSEKQNFGIMDTGVGKNLHSPLPKPRVQETETIGNKEQDFKKEKVDEGVHQISTPQKTIIEKPIPTPRVRHTWVKGRKERNFDTNDKPEIRSHQIMAYEQRCFGKPVPRPRPRPQNLDSKDCRAILSTADILLPSNPARTDSQATVNKTKSGLGHEARMPETISPSDDEISSEKLAWAMFHGIDPLRSAKYCNAFFSGRLGSVNPQEDSLFSESDDIHVSIPVPISPDSDLCVARWLLNNDFTSNSMEWCEEVDSESVISDRDVSRKCRVFLCTDDTISRQSVRNRFKTREIVTSEEDHVTGFEETDPGHEFNSARDSANGDTSSEVDDHNIIHCDQKPGLKSSSRFLQATWKRVKTFGRKLGRNLVCGCLSIAN